jgi:branched-chain amino acid transport system permease protein
LPRPLALRGSVIIAGAPLERYRLMVCVLGLVIYAATQLALNRTRLGLLIRAAVENREMVEALGFRANTLFRLVFAAGTALAAVGGVVFALYAGMVTADLGGEIIILVFIVVIIGGLGSVNGCFLASLLLGLANNYVGFLAPKLALGTDIALMLIVLLWRPRGLLPMDGA